MIECPWCHEHVQLNNDICPACKQEVFQHHLNHEGKVTEAADGLEFAYDDEIDLSWEERIANQFTCAKCKHKACRIKEVAMTGTGLSKILDIQHHHFLFVSCLYCGFVEIFDPDELHSKKVGEFGTMIDILFRR